MLQNWVVVLASFLYIGVLFTIAYYGDKRADAGRSIIANPYIYTLSIAVYCTAWTFYGSAGRAASTGVGFLPIYLGPTLVAVLFWFVLRRIVRISKIHRITSIADFVASRYGKSSLLGGLVTVIVVVGIMPYISIQLKAIAVSFNVLGYYPDILPTVQAREQPIWADTALYTALLLIVFTILFGTRHIDNTERHEGLVAAVAFESLFKLVAFMALGLFVTFGMFDGFGDVFQRAIEHPELMSLMRFESMPGGYGGWLSLTFLAMMAFLFLPRQFQVLVVENVNEEHIRKAAWLFPLYLLLINLFVLPIAFSGLLIFPDLPVDHDTFVLALPMAEQRQALALLVYLGGLSAATSMVIVETVALSTMVCNDLVMPVLLRIKALRLIERRDLTGLLLGIRRSSIVVMILLGWLYYRLIGESYALVTVGLVSFTAAAQFGPVILLGIYWKRASRLGAYLGLGGGFLMWFYTLVLPSFARSGWLPVDFIEQGLFGWELLKPYQFLGLAGLDPYTHAVIWSMLVNLGGLVLGSLLSHQDAIERVQASQFVEIYERGRRGDSLLWRGTAEVSEIYDLIARFVGRRKADEAFKEYTRTHQVNLSGHLQADPQLVHFAERLLAGAIGAASARVMISSIVKGEVLSIEEVMTILDETSHAIEYSRRLEEKSLQLEAATAELREANARLQELDRLKDEFVSTISHELRTPLTSIRAFSEILLANLDMEEKQRSEFLGIIVKESERLTRLINQVLDLAKIDSGRVDWQAERLDVRALAGDAINATSQLFRDKKITLEHDLGEDAVELVGDYDRLTQVLINLLSNAVKFCADEDGRVSIRLETDATLARIRVRDNGPGIPKEQQRQIFEKFHQVSNQQAGKPKGTGLGLPISQRIVEHHGGAIWVESAPGKGAEFVVELPMGG